MDKHERRICIYSSLLIVLVVNSPRLLALRENGIIARYWQFDLVEYSFQFLYNLLFCLILFYINLSKDKSLALYLLKKRYSLYFLANIIVILLFIIIGSFIQSNLFFENHLPGVVVRGYFVRLLFSAVLIGIIIRILLLLRESKLKEKENEQLKRFYLEAQLQLLKEQLNPHLLFNSLSSLSGIVREDPKLAQFYIIHLSKVFRNALEKSGTMLVSLAEELRILKSYEELLKMRYEKAFHFVITIDEHYLNFTLPHLSLQPLLENAIKHNAVSIERPLVITIYVEDEWLVVSNNLQEIISPENSTGIGLVNLNERFRLLKLKEIDIKKTKDTFLVKLPLIP